MKSSGIALVVSMFPLSLAGQVCLGSPAMGENSAGNVGLGASFFDGGKRYSVNATFGGKLFGSGGFGYTDFDNTTLSFKVLGGILGYEIVSGGSSNISLCPSLGIGYGFGLEVGTPHVTPVTNSPGTVPGTVTISPGVAVGVEVEISPSVVIAPFAQISLIHTLWSEPVTLGDSADGGLDLGLGVIFSGRFSVGSAVFIPIKGGYRRFGAGVSLAVGGTR